MRHQGPEPEYRLGDARRRRRAELREHVAAPRGQREKGRNMRWAILAAGVAAASLTAGLTTSVAAQDNKPEGAATVQHAVVDESSPPAQQLLVTSPPNAAPDRTYSNVGDALKE